MTLLKKYPPEGFIKQKHQYMAVIIYALYLVTSETFGRIFGTKSTESYIYLNK